MSTASERTCPYCGYRFETVADRDAHVPCPDRYTDTLQWGE